MASASQTSKEMRDKFYSNQKSVLGQDDSNWNMRMQLMSMANKSPSFAAGAFLGRALRPKVNAWLDELFDRPVKSETTPNPVTSNPEAFNNAFAQQYNGNGTFDIPQTENGWGKRAKDYFNGTGYFNGGY